MTPDVVQSDTTASTTDESPAPLRVMTYNIHSCVGGDRRYDPERILAILREVDADIIALQEVGGFMHGELEQAHFFEHKLDMKAVIGHNRFRSNISFGNVLLVRKDIEIEDMSLVDLSVVPFERRGAIDCILRTRIGPIRTIATHLGLLVRERRKQIEIIANRLLERPQPITLILGDFNIFGPERRRLRLIGAPTVLPKIYSFPARRPLMSLDRIWAIPNDRLTKLDRLRTPLSRIASDHLPLVGIVEPT
ncbi:MAG: putative endonuclease/exonuclease/phosphatase [Rhodospirillales bacterium]|nr:putative endonuclease/exonuclease/phosphatase [Rhodospirillales bacterium]